MKTTLDAFCDIAGAMDDMMTTESKPTDPIAALIEADKLRTPEWRVQGTTDDCDVLVTEIWDKWRRVARCDAHDTTDEQKIRNFDFIAAAANAMPAIVEMVEENEAHERNACTYTDHVAEMSETIERLRAELAETKTKLLYEEDAAEKGRVAREVCGGMEAELAECKRSRDFYRNCMEYGVDEARALAQQNSKEGS